MTVSASAALNAAEDYYVQVPPIAKTRRARGYGFPLSSLHTATGTRYLVRRTRRFLH
jgi:hypothetical protein